MRQKMQFKLLSSDPELAFAVDHFTVIERISKPYLVTVDLVSEDIIAVENAIRGEASLKIGSAGGVRFFHGIINCFTITGKHGRFYTYQATLVPTLWLLSLSSSFRIFQNVTVVEIVSQLLDENDITSDDYVFKTVSEYGPRRYCTQYGENTLQFICRVLEEEGVFFFFVHGEESHTIVFSDTEAVYCPIEGESAVRLKTDSGMVAGEETIKTIAYNRTICPGKVTHNNYNFKRPSLSLQLSEEGDTDERHEIYEYPGSYGLPSEGALKLKNRLEEVKSLEESVQGTGNVPRFIPGSTFSVSEHSVLLPNDEYCLVAVEHEGAQPTVFGEYSGIGGDYTYANHFTAIPASKAYRARNTFDKPFAHGLQTAIVTGPEGQEIHVDGYGRIKVQFHWDREGKHDGKSSCWLRTCQPWSGNGWGLASLPRVGDEVLVGFINGDPDWPIVVGSVNNAASPALYTLPDNKTKSGIKTRSSPGGGLDKFNELRFEDKNGAEEVYLQCEKDWNILVKNHKTENVRQNTCTKIGGNATVTVQKSSSETAEDITLTARTKITMQCGNSSIVMSPSGIEINGVIVKVNS